MRIAFSSWIHPKHDQIPRSAFADDIFTSSGGNTGNLVHANAYSSVLGKHEFTSVHVWEEAKINSNDILLLGCANQLREQFHVTPEGRAHLKRVRIPVIACSLGAQAESEVGADSLEPDPTFLDFLRIVDSKRASSSPNISVRGEFSRQVLRRYGIDSKVTGCITTLQFKPQIGDLLKTKFAEKKMSHVCVAGTNPHYRWTTQLEKQMMEIVESFNGIHIVQSPKEMISLAMGEAVELPDWFEKVYRVPKQDIKRWFLRFGRVFTNTDLWANALRMYDLVIGARYHGVALAIASEVLGTVFSVDSRTNELCETSGIKKIEINELLNKTPTEILQMSSWNEEDFAHLTNQSEFYKNEYREFFKTNGIEI